MFLLAATVVLTAVGCCKDDAAQEEVKYVSEIKIGFEGDTRVTAAHSEAGLKFAWSDGDVVRVRPISNINAVHEFTYNSSTDSFNATGVNGVLDVGEDYIAEFGYQFTVTGETAATGILIAEAPDGFGEKNLPMVSETFTATAETTFATMHHIVGVVEVPVKADTGTLSLESIQLTNPYGSYHDGWAGSYDVNLSTNAITVKDGQGSVNRKLTFDPVKSISTTVISIFIPVLPMQDVDVLLQYKLAGKEDSKNVEFAGKKLTVERGKITKISEVILTNY